MEVLAPDTAVGLVGVAVWESGTGFPEEIEHAIQEVYVPITDGTAQVTIDRLTPGQYAVTVYHDANDNGRFDKNWIGLPQEAWGVSNNVRPRLRAPRFEEAAFELGPGRHLIAIELKQ